MLRNITIIGAGVIGLTTAVKLQDSGYTVTLVAETLPTDPKNIRYTSPWAGAHHVSSAKDDPWLQKLDMDTFKIMWDMSVPGSGAEECFLRVIQTEFYEDKEAETAIIDAWKDMPDFRHLAKEELITGAEAGVQFTTVTIDTSKYLPYLFSKFLKGGGHAVRDTVQHISQVVEGAFFPSGSNGIVPEVHAVVVCTGIGSRSLGGVEDKAVYPIRGQTVLLKAPWVRYGRTLVEKNGIRTYIIPRKSGDVIVGGTMDQHDWYPKPRPETTTDILKRVIAICPELAPEEICAARAPTADDLIPLIIEEGCGLRPARTSGVRIELVSYEITRVQKKVPVVFNYGHGGFGYQSSWGSAAVAQELLESAAG